MGEIPEERLLRCDSFIHELDSLLSPQVTPIPGRIELRIIAGNLLAVEEHFSAPFGSGLVREMQTSGRQIQTAMKPAAPWGHAVIEANMPLAGHESEVPCARQYLRKGDALLIKMPTIPG